MMSLGWISRGSKRSIRGFQRAVVAWKDSFLTGTPYEPDLKVSAFRVLEEAGELMQALGLTEEECLRQIRYTYSRPPGEAAQEAAQTLVNLVFIAKMVGFDLEDEAISELRRIDTPEMKTRIYEKQALKRQAGLA